MTSGLPVVLETSVIVDEILHKDSSVTPSPKYAVDQLLIRDETITVLDQTFGLRVTSIACPSIPVSGIPNACSNQNLGFQFANPAAATAPANITHETRYTSATGEADYTYLPDLTFLYALQPKSDVRVTPCMALVDGAENKYVVFRTLVSFSEVVFYHIGGTVPEGTTVDDWTGFFYITPADEIAPSTYTFRLDDSPNVEPTSFNTFQGDVSTLKVSYPHLIASAGGVPDDISFRSIPTSEELHSRMMEVGPE